MRALRAYPADIHRRRMRKVLGGTDGKGAAMKNMHDEPKIRASDLRRESELLIEQGKMPPLEAVLQAVAETRAKYAALILRACRENDDR